MPTSSPSAAITASPPGCPAHPSRPRPSAAAAGRRAPREQDLVLILPVDHEAELCGQRLELHARTPVVEQVGLQGLVVADRGHDVGRGQRRSVHLDRDVGVHDRAERAQPAAVDRDRLGTGLPEAVDQQPQVGGADPAVGAAVGVVGDGDPDPGPVTATKPVLIWSWRRSTVASASALRSRPEQSRRSSFCGPQRVDPLLQRGDLVLALVDPVDERVPAGLLDVGVARRLHGGQGDQQAEDDGGDRRAAQAGAPGRRGAPRRPGAGPRARSPRRPPRG